MAALELLNKRLQEENDRLREKLLEKERDFAEATAERDAAVAETKLSKVCGLNCCSKSSSFPLFPCFDFPPSCSVNGGVGGSACTGPIATRECLARVGSQIRKRETDPARVRTGASAVDEDDGRDEGRLGAFDGGRQGRGS